MKCTGSNCGCSQPATPTGWARDDWEEAAKISNMKLGDYAYEQVKIAEEMAAGGTAGWTRGDGTVQR